MTPCLFAAQCPDMPQIRVNHHWQTPDSWTTVPLSPLADSAGGRRMIKTTGLYQVFYLSRSAQLRCIYSTAGQGAVGNTYVIAKKITTFQAIGPAWEVIRHHVWSCRDRHHEDNHRQHQRMAISAAICQWQSALEAPSLG